MVILPVLAFELFGSRPWAFGWGRGEKGKWTGEGREREVDGRNWKHTTILGEKAQQSDDILVYGIESTEMPCNSSSSNSASSLPIPSLTEMITWSKSSPGWRAWYGPVEGLAPQACLGATERKAVREWTGPLGRRVAMGSRARMVIRDRQAPREPLA